MSLIERAFDALNTAGVRVCWYGHRRVGMPTESYVAVSRGKTEPIGGGPAARVTVLLLACVPVIDYGSLPAFIERVRAAMADEPRLAFTGRIGPTRSEQGLGVCTMELEYVGIEPVEEDPDEEEGEESHEGEG